MDRVWRRAWHVPQAPQHALQAWGRPVGTPCGQRMQPSCAKGFDKAVPSGRKNDLRRSLPINDPCLLGGRLSTAMLATSHQPVQEGQGARSRFPCDA